MRRYFQPWVVGEVSVIGEVRREWDGRCRRISVVVMDGRFDRKRLVEGRRVGRLSSTEK